MRAQHEFPLSPARIYRLPLSPQAADVPRNAPVYTALHQSHVRLGDLGAAARVLQEAGEARVLDGNSIGKLTMNSLKKMLRREGADKGQWKGKASGKELDRSPLAPADTRRAWGYFRRMQQADMANIRHYTKMLEACAAPAEVEGLLRDLERATIRPNAAIFTALHKVHVRLGQWAAAGEVLRQARHQGLLDISDADHRGKPFSIRLLDATTLSAIATNTLRQLTARRSELLAGPPSGRVTCQVATLEAGLATYLEAVRAAGIASPVHYSVLLDGAQDRTELQRWLGEMEVHGIGRDERCWTIVHKALARLGDYGGAVDALAEGHAAGAVGLEAAGQCATGTLGELLGGGKGPGGVMGEAAWSFFGALRQQAQRAAADPAGGKRLLSRHHYNLMIGASPPLAAAHLLSNRLAEGDGLVRRLAAEPDWSALPDLPKGGRTGVGLLAEMGRWVPPILADAKSYTNIHEALVGCGRPGFSAAVEVLAAGRAAGLVDQPTASCAATNAIQQLLGHHGDGRGRDGRRPQRGQQQHGRGEPAVRGTYRERAEAAREYGRLLRAAELADAFHFCCIIRHATPDREALRCIYTHRPAPRPDASATSLLL
jgi:hypothetical protein